MADSRFLKISEVIRPKTVDLNLKNIENKDQVIHYLAGLLDDAGLIIDKRAYIDSVYEREIPFMNANPWGQHIWRILSRSLMANATQLKKRGLHLGVQKPDLIIKPSWVAGR
jgi:hypothetical protein